MAKTLDAAEITGLRAAFQAIDADSSGKLSISEIATELRKLERAGSVQQHTPLKIHRLSFESGVETGVWALDSIESGLGKATGRAFF